MIKDGAPEIPEAVAYQLLLHIMEAEGRPLTARKEGAPRIARHIVLDAYAECLEAVRGQRKPRTVAKAA
jgi:hypothetical protein